MLHNSDIRGGAIFSEATTNGGYMFFYQNKNSKWIEFGPAESLFWGSEVILSKKNGKWAVLWGEKSEKYLSEITPYIYDAVINVGEVYFWVKKDGKWFAIDRDNKKISKSPAILKKYQNLSSLSFDEYIQAQRDVKTCKISMQEASYIYVANYKYTAW